MTSKQIKAAKLEWRKLRAQLRHQVEYGAPAADR